jgi:DNA repair protein RecN (Recombination protein N)
VASYASGLESDPARLAAVSERRAALTALTRKYGETSTRCSAWSEASAQRLFELDDTDDRIAALRAERDDLRRRWRAGRDDLGRAARRRAAPRRPGDRRAHPARDAPRRVAVSVARHDDADGPGGRRARGALRSRRHRRRGAAAGANVGADARPLAKGASGGELSRVMLALEVVLAGTSPVPTFVFDEVDAGVGGKAAVEVGRRLAMLARTSQVVVVTHLPQVAAYADWHVVVHKSSDGRSPRPACSVLDDEAGCGSCRGCSPAWRSPRPRWRTPRSSSPARVRCAARRLCRDTTCPRVLSGVGPP